MVGSRSSEKGNSGWLARNSRRMSSVRETTAVATSIAVAATFAPARLRICSSAISAGATNSTKYTRPGVSKRQSPVCGGRRSRRRANHSAASPSGRLIQKIERQPNRLVSQPPATGPNAFEKTTTAAR